MTRVLLALAALAAAGPALAQAPAYPGATVTIGTIVIQPNDTGGVEDETLPSGSTVSDTINTNPVAGSNASRPERALPDGNANDGGNG